MNADQLYLTHSFRFGPNVSLVANALLELKGETRPVVGRGPADQVLMFLPVTWATAQYFTEPSWGL